MKKRLLALALCAALLLVGSVALAAQENPNVGQGLFPGTSEPGTIVIDATSQDVMNPIKQTYSDEFSVNRHIWDCLVKLSVDDNSVVPAAAESWESSEDGMTWTFHIRQGMKWVDSTGAVIGDVTANDFVFAWSELIKPENACEYAYFGYVFKNAEKYANGECTLDEVGFKAVDDYTLVCELENYLPYFLQYVKFEVMAPIYEPFYTKVGADNYGTTPENLAFNGAFYMTEYALEDHITVVRNPEWWDADNVEVQKIVFKKITDNNALLNAFMGGEMDVIDLGDGTMRDTLRGYGYQTASYAGGYSFFFWANCDPNSGRDISNVNLRKAISAAIDRTQFINTVYKNDNQPSPSVAFGISGVNTETFGEAVLAANNGEPLYSPTAEPEKAQEYLAAALEELGKTADQIDVTLMTSEGTVNELNSQVVQEQVRQVLGIELKTEILTLAEARARRNAHEYDLFHGGWGPDYNDPMTDMDLFETGGGNNHCAYSNPEYDALLDKARAEVDPVAREQLFVQMEQIVADDMVVIPTFWQYEDYAVSEKIASGYNRMPFVALNFIYTKLAE